MIPEGRVAYPIPVTRYTSVAWALKPGDHVDVLLSLSMVDMDEEFHTVLPNQISCFSGGGGEDGQPTCPSGPMGRFEVLPNGVLVNVLPSGDQVPRMVTQLTVQNAIVLRVGDWREAQQPEGAGAPEVAEGNEEQEQEAQETQPAQRPVTLAVSPQDAAVLEYAWLSNARVTLLLRRAGDEEATFTDPVTLQYVLDTYNIDVPSKLPYGLAPSAEQPSSPPAE
jgi:Flp pilus assembly protein CpaB